MANQEFSEADLDEAMADQAITFLSGWTDPNADEKCSEAVYRQKLSANHAGYAAKIEEQEVDSMQSAGKTLENAIRDNTGGVGGFLTEEQKRVIRAGRANHAENHSAYDTEKLIEGADVFAAKYPLEWLEKK